MQTCNVIVSHKLVHSLTCVCSRNSFIAMGDTNGTIQCYDTLHEVFLKPKDGHEGPVTSVAMDPEATLMISTGRDHNVILWRLLDTVRGVHAEKRVLTDHLCAVLSSAISGNGQLMVTGGADGDIILWGSLGRPVARRLRGHRNWVTALEFSHDSKLFLSVDQNGALSLWDVNRQYQLHIVHLGTPLQCVSFSYEDSSLILTGGDDGGVRVLSRSDGNLVRELSGHTEGVTKIAMHKRGLFISSSLDKTIRIWNARGQCVHIHPAHTSGIKGFTLNPAGNLLVTVGEDGYFKMWNLSVTESM